MLGNYEKRRFAEGEKIWLGRYRDLKNLLHWHFECELIRIVSGTARIIIGAQHFSACAGDCFFCPDTELHSITGAPGSLIEIIIFDRSVVKDITDLHTPASPRLPDCFAAAQALEQLRRELEQKAPFYREYAENRLRGLILDIFRSCPIEKRESKPPFYAKLIGKINEEFSFITFRDAAAYSGYSPAHFSKLFKALCGMNFSEYLNIIKVENAVALLRSEPGIAMTAVCLRCGFSTVRNFNRVPPPLIPQTKPPSLYKFRFIAVR